MEMEEEKKKYEVLRIWTFFLSGKKLMG